MAKIIFYEKTGCINNTKQKEILALAGHEVEAINLLHYEWSAEKLDEFFAELPAEACFNKNAPKVTSGEVVPSEYTKEAAIEALLKEPILIKRPLLEIGDERFVGFDKTLLDEKIGLTKMTIPRLDVLMNENLNDCPNKSNSCD